MSETPTHFTAVCPHCLMSLKVPSEYSGENVRCKYCTQKFRALSPDFPSGSGSGSSDRPAASIGPRDTAPERMAVSCPHCSTYLSVRRAYAGQNVRCGRCGEKFSVPQPSEPPGESGSVTIPSAARSESDILSQLYAFLASEASGGPSPTGQGGTPEEQFAAILDERERLRAELERQRRQHKALGEERERIRAERDRLTEDCAAIEKDRDSLRVTLDQLRGEMDRIGAEREDARQESHRLAAELAEIRDALGPTRPGEVGTLRDEHAASRSEADDLRRRVQTLEAELNSRGELAQNLMQRDEELRTARREVDELHLKIEQHSQALEVAQAEREARSHELCSLRDRLEAAHGERDGLSERIRQLEHAAQAADAERDQLARENAALRVERDAAHGERDGLGRELSAVRDELGAAQAERERLSTAVGDHEARLHALLARGEEELDASRTEIERLAGAHRAALDERDRLHETLERARDEWGQEGDRLRAEIDHLRRSLDDEGQVQAGAQRELAEQLRQSREQLAAAEARAVEAQSRIEELRADRETLESEHREIIEAERSRFAGELAEAQARAEENARLADRLKAEIAAISQTPSAPASEGDLEAAQEEIAGLRSKLAEIERSKQSMSSLLEGMGIRLGDHFVASTRPRESR